MPGGGGTCGAGGVGGKGNGVNRKIWDEGVKEGESARQEGMEVRGEGRGRQGKRGKGRRKGRGKGSNGEIWRHE